jgi:hypothetical protein
MCFPDNHLKPELRGQAKGIKLVLQEHKLVWDKYVMKYKEHSTKAVRKCGSYSKSQMHKDTESHIMKAEAIGQGDPAIVDNIAETDTMAPPISEDMWCYIEHVLLLQDNFKAEKPLI